MMRTFTAPGDIFPDKWVVTKVDDSLNFNDLKEAIKIGH
jgi:hypothetical protein